MAPTEPEFVKKNMKILHVTDCFHGGVATAVDQYARLLPEHRHFLLSNNSRSSALPTSRSPGAFATDHELPSTPLAAISAVRDTISHLRPDVVHAHSSFAGVYVRLAAALDRVTLHRPPTPVVYTPHSFAFERADVNTTKRRAFRLLEKLLYPLTTVGAPCAQWEGVLMNRLGRNVPWKVPVIVVPNVLATDHSSPADSWAPTIPPTVGVVSRVTPQRDPVFFASTVRLIREVLPDTRFIWIGEEDGKDGSLTSVLKDAGVEVTGWLSGAELHRSIAELSVALHPARWDGFPMSILEIRRIGVPLLVRDIPALRECPETSRFTTPEEAADKAIRILTLGQDPTDWTRMDGAHAAQTQHDNLASVYDLAVGRTSAQAVVP